jgi:glutamate 5-kinase
VRGQFGVGAPVQCLTTTNKVIAAGLTNYSSADIEKIKGCRSSEIKNILGFSDSDEVIHRDNLVLLDKEHDHTNLPEEVE